MATPDKKDDPENGLTKEAPVENQSLSQKPLTVPGIVFTPSNISLAAVAASDHEVPAEVHKQPSGVSEVKVGKPLEHLEELTLNHDIKWMTQFTWIKIFLIIFGRWPFTYSDEPQKRGYVFKFSWTCVGFVMFAATTLFTLYGLIATSINVVDILLSEKVSTTRTYTEIIEQGLAERHTMIIIIMLGSYGINAVTLYFIFVRRHEISSTFTKWTRFLHFSKLNGGSPKVSIYVGVAAGNFIFIQIVYVVLTVYKVSATLIGGPVVVSMLFVRHFLPANYFENFVGSSRHKLMHTTGLIIYLYVITSCNTYMYLLLWLLKSVESSFCSWNLRMLGVVEASSVTPAGEEEISTSQLSSNTHNNLRLSYNALYHDHIGLVRMLSWFNKVFAYILEPYILFGIIKIVYQMYLAALVIKSNGKPLNVANVGKYFIRKGDYIPHVLLTYENGVMMLSIFLASAWLEDTAYDSYDVLRKNSLLKTSTSDRESFFFLSMFQSYKSTTKMAICGGHFFCIDRYTILHVLSAIMSNYLVVYQFEPLFDMDTVGNEDARNTMGKFLEAFEGLHPNHTIPVIESLRNKIGF